VIGRQRNGVFLSYARADGEQFASALRERLREKASDIDIKQDRLLLEGGVGWWKQLSDAIESVEFLVLVMTPSELLDPGNTAVVSYQGLALAGPQETGAKRPPYCRRPERSRRRSEPDRALV